MGTTNSSSAVDQSSSKEPKGIRQRLTARHKIIAAAIVVILVGAGIGWRVWPRPIDQRDALHAAAQALASLPAVDLTAVITAPSSQFDFQAEMTVMASGEAAGTITQRMAGKADFAAADGWARVRGDTDFWATRYPLDISSAVGRWVTPDQDNFRTPRVLGIDPASFSPPTLSKIVSDVSEAADLICNRGERVDDHDAFVCTSGEWTVAVSSAKPHSVLAVGGYGKPEGSPLRTTHALWNPRSSFDTSTPHLGPVVRPADSSIPNPYAWMIVHSANLARRDALARKIAEATPPKTPPPDLEITGRSYSAKEALITFAILDRGTCYDPQCPVEVKISNRGGKPGDATVYVTITADTGESIPDQEFRVGSLQPGQSVTRTVTTKNFALEAGREVRVHVSGWAYMPEKDGGDAQLTRRLRARGFNLADPTIADLDPPYKQMALRFLDRAYNFDTAQIDMQKSVQDAVLTMFGMSILGLWPEMSNILSNVDRLQNPFDLPTLVNKIYYQDRKDIIDLSADPRDPPERIGNRRVLQQAAQILGSDPTAKVWLDGRYVVDGQTYKADILYTGTENGVPVQRCMQVKTTQTTRYLGDYVGTASKQLNGLRGKESDGIAQNCPPNFERIIVLNLEPEIGRLFDYDHSQLDKYVKSDSFAKSRSMMCDENGRLLADRLVITNKTGSWDWDDLAKIGILCPK